MHVSSPLVLKFAFLNNKGILLAIGAGLLVPGPGNPASERHEHYSNLKLYQTSTMVPWTMNWKALI